MNINVIDLFKYLDETYASGHCEESLDKARWLTVNFYSKGLFDAWDIYTREHENNIYRDDIEEHVECIHLANTLQTKCGGWIREVMGQLAKKPTYDGDVSSKEALH